MRRGWGRGGQAGNAASASSSTKDPSLALDCRIRESGWRKSKPQSLLIRPNVLAATANKRVIVRSRRKTGDLKAIARSITLLASPMISITSACVCGSAIFLIASSKRLLFGRSQLRVLMNVMIRCGNVIKCANRMDCSSDFRIVRYSSEAKSSRPATAMSKIRSLFSKMVWRVISVHSHCHGP